MRTLECDRFVSYLETQGVTDFTLIGACAVTKDVEERVINSISSSNNRIIVIGCISQRIRNAAEKAGAIHILNTTTLEELFKNGADIFPNIQNIKPYFVISNNTLCNRQYKSIKSYNRNLLQRIIQRNTIIPFLVVARGCNNNCSYCHSRLFMGKLLSKNIDQILSEYNELVNRSYPLINIIAGDVGSYGHDISSNLPYLLFNLEKHTPDQNTKWMLDGLQPRWFIKYKDDLLPYIIKKRLVAMSIPIQSGSNRILELMNRPPNIKESLEVLCDFRKYNKMLYLQGIFIVGFPGESIEDFKLSLDFILSVKFNEVTLIQYSEFDVCASRLINPKVSSISVNDRINMAKGILKENGIRVN